MRLLRQMHPLAGLAAALALTGCATPTPASVAAAPQRPVPAESTLVQPFDLVILHGRVMDPQTNFDAVANVGIEDGRIVAITSEAILGAQTIDAAGLVVAPGFIDTHFHALDGLAIRLAARDGVTTAMDLEVGAYRIDAWYAQKQGHWPLNYGTTVSQELARMAVHDPEVTIEGPADATVLFELRAEAANDGVSGWSETVSSVAQINEITTLLDEGLRQGALGIGSTIGYARTGISTYEMFEAQRAAARYGRLTAAHARFHANNHPPVEAPLGFDELLANAMLLDAPLLYQHDNEWGWWEIEDKLRLARARGMNVWSEYYPYASAATTIAAELVRPESLEQRLGYEYEDTLYDPEQDKFLTKQEYLELVAADPDRLVVVVDPARERWLPYFVKLPHMAVASDSMPSGRSWDAGYADYVGHPRTAGTHGRTLALAREQNVPLMLTLAQMSYWPAKHLGDAGLEAMAVRGRMQVGMVADITIFDPDSVRDDAGYRRGAQGRPTIGIPHVIVNGQRVVQDSEFRMGVWAGQAIRYPVEGAARFVPVGLEYWERTMAIDAGGVSPELRPRN